MKNVKFTLGLMLSLLFAGVSVSNAQWGDHPILGNRTYLFIKPSLSYANGTSLAEFIPGTTANDAIKLGDYFQKGTTLRAVRAGIIEGDDVRTTAQDYIWKMYPTADFLDSVKKYPGYKFYQEFTVKLSYDKGKDIIPFLKRTILTVTDDNEFIVVQDLLLAADIKEKTDFTYGSGTATYTYKSDVLPFLLKYEVATVIYELWTGEEISNDPGAGNAYPTIPRAVTVFAEDGLTTTPFSGMTQYVDAYKDFTFEVSGDPSKELEITTNNSNYAIGKGITVTPVGDGKWKVKVTRVYTALNIYVAYKSAPESNEGGGDGSNGNLGVQSDAVWASGGTLYVKAATPGTLSVYSVTGQIQETKTVSGSSALSNLPKGYYIVKLNNKAYKVTIN
ncbi:MAG: T9SS type A sorting domain-containing protein [Tannerella sp.]|jgi:hypothetical protein|nr:T9SS type A sorting domain-containing protein [Tannerella sp.]